MLSIFWWKIFRVEYFHDNITSSDVCPNYPKISLIFRTESTTRVFSASGGVIMFITMVILCEKCTCLPKPITRYHLLHQSHPNLHQNHSHHVHHNINPLWRICLPRWKPPSSSSSFPSRHFVYQPSNPSIESYIFLLASASSHDIGKMSNHLRYAADTLRK